MNIFGFTILPSKLMKDAIDANESLKALVKSQDRLLESNRRLMEFLESQRDSLQEQLLECETKRMDEFVNNH
jgi:hypothetical protein